MSLTKYSNHILKLILPHHGGDSDLFAWEANDNKGKISCQFFNAPMERCHCKHVAKGLLLPFAKPETITLKRLTISTLGY